MSNVTIKQTNPMQKALAALAAHPKCGAYCRTTQAPCKNAAMKNGRCRMHGGRSTGRPVIHGCNTKVSQAFRKQNREIIRALEESILKLR